MVVCVAMLGCGDGKSTNGKPKVVEIKVPDTPDGTAKAFLDGLADGKPAIAWAMLPASYQKDVKGLIDDFAGKMDAELYDKGFSVAKKLVAVVRKQKAFILASPMMKQAPVDPKQLDEKWDAVVAILDTVVNSDISSVASLKALDVNAFLQTTGAKVMAQASHVSKLMPQDDYNQAMAMLKDVTVECTKKDEKTATLKLTHPKEEEPEDVEMVCVDGKWLPKDMVASWADGIAEVKKGLDEISPEEIAKHKDKIMTVLKGVEPLLDQMLNAKSQEEFDQVVMQTVGMIGGAMMGGADSGPGAMPLEPTKQ
jgi:hypothetical protein